MASAFSSFAIAPDYARGFSYSWAVSGDFCDPAPWRFRIFEGPSGNGPWTPISPTIENGLFWRESGGHHLVNKSNVLYFRMELSTPSGTYFSEVVQPYGSFESKRDFLLAREIIRREALRARVLSGVPCKVYIKSTFGPRCPHCLDPDTGDVRDSNCKYCLGTGRCPPYYGPYDMAMSFSTDAAHRKDNSVDGTHETKMFEALAVGNPVLKQGDVIIDATSDKRYVIGVASVVSEVRRIACLQRLAFEEAAPSDPVYGLSKEGACLLK